MLAVKKKGKYEVRYCAALRRFCTGTANHCACAVAPLSYWHGRLLRLSGSAVVVLTQQAVVRLKFNFEILTGYFTEVSIAVKM